MQNFFYLFKGIGLKRVEKSTPTPNPPMVRDEDIEDAAQHVFGESSEELLKRKIEGEKKSEDDWRHRVLRVLIKHLPYVPPLISTVNHFLRIIEFFMKILQ